MMEYWGIFPHLINIKDVWFFRTFLGLTIDTGTHWLKSLVSGIDTALQEYRLPVYYKVRMCKMYWCLSYDFCHHVVIPVIFHVLAKIFFGLVMTSKLNCCFFFFFFFFLFFCNLQLVCNILLNQNFSANESSSYTLFTFSEVYFLYKVCFFH